MLFDFDRHWADCAEKVLGYRLTVQRQVYALCDRYGLTPTSVAKVWAGWEAMDGWAAAPPRPEGIRTIRMLLDMGHSVTVVTKLPHDEAVAGRRRSLQRHGIGNVDLVSVKGSKADVLASLRPHFFADDTVQHCKEAVGVMVPHVVRIQSWGDEILPAGIEEYPCLETAIQDFFRQYAQLTRC